MFVLFMSSKYSSYFSFYHFRFTFGRNVTDIDLRAHQILYKKGINDFLRWMKLSGDIKA